MQTLIIKIAYGHVVLNVSVVVRLPKLISVERSRLLKVVPLENARDHKVKLNRF